MNKTLINKRWIFFVTMFSFLVLFGLFTLEEEVGISIAIITLGLILISGYAFIIPNSYTFSACGCNTFRAADSELHITREWNTVPQVLRLPSFFHR